jgi:molecular chaperone HscB
MAVCPECGAELETLLGCAACGAPLATADDVTPFAAFGLEPAAAIDARELKQRLLRFSRIVHPDFHCSDPARRALAERSTAALNDAYAVLSDDAARYDWLVRHLGGPDQDTERQMPQAFLMEVMEWNEALEEAREAPPDAPLPGGASCASTAPSASALPPWRRPLPTSARKVRWTTRSWS